VINVKGSAFVTGELGWGKRTVRNGVHEKQNGDVGSVRATAPEASRFPGVGAA